MKHKLAFIALGLILPASSILACLSAHTQDNPQPNTGVCYCNNDGTLGTCTAGVVKPGDQHCGSALPEGKKGYNCTESQLPYHQNIPPCTCTFNGYGQYNCQMATASPVNTQMATDTACPGT